MQRSYNPSPSQCETNFVDFFKPAEIRKCKTANSKKCFSRIQKISLHYIIALITPGFTS